MLCGMAQNTATTTSTNYVDNDEDERQASTKYSRISHDIEEGGVERPHKLERNRERENERKSESSISAGEVVAVFFLSSSLVPTIFVVVVSHFKLVCSWLTV